MRHWAERNSPDLLLKMSRYAARAPLMLKALIKEKYGDFSGDALMDEIGAGRFERAMGERFQKLLAESPEVRGWWRKVLHALARAWKGMARTVGGNRIDLKKIEKMDPEEAIEKLAEQMLEGRRLGEAKGMSGEGERRFSIINMNGRSLAAVTNIEEVKKLDGASNGSIENYILTHLEKDIPLLFGGKADINETSAKHFGWSRYPYRIKNKKHARQFIRARRQAATILHDMLSQASANAPQKDYHGGSAKYWHSQVPFAIPILDAAREKVIGANVFTGDVVVKDEGHGKFFYDIVDIKKDVALTGDLAKQLDVLRDQVKQESADDMSRSAANLSATGKAQVANSIPQQGGGAQGEIRPQMRYARKLSGTKARELAESLETAGASREEIWEKTGWWRGKDGKWREGPLPSPLGDGNQKYYEVPFDKAVDKIVANGKSVGKEGVFVSSTPEVFERIGFARLPIMMTQNHVLTISSSAKTMAALGIKGHPHDMKDVLK